MKNFNRILTYIKPYAPYIGLNIVFNVMSILFSVFSFVVFIPFLRLIFGNVQQIHTIPISPENFSMGAYKDYVVDSFNYHFGQVLINEGAAKALLLICIAIAIIFFFKNITRYLALFFMVKARYGVVKDIRSKLYHKVLSLRLAFYSKNKKGDVISRMTADVQEIDASIMNMLETTVKEPLTILAFLSFMLIISAKLTLFVLIFLPITAFIVGKIGKTLKRVSLKGQEQLGALLSQMDETISGLKIIKAFNGEAFQKNKFEALNQSYIATMTKMLRRRDMSSPLSEFLGVIVIVTVLWFGGKLILSEGIGLQAETFLVYIMLFSQLLNPAKSFSAAFYHIQKGLASVERIEELLQEEKIIIEKEKPLSLETLNEKIVFENVFFAYNEQEVLKNINLEVIKGKSLALVGESGGGKSTLVDLLPRFYDPTKGSIFIDGINIKDVKLSDLRNLIGIVTQQPILFNDTVYNNIVFGFENITKEDVIKAAKIANAHDFIKTLEEGYDTNIGDSGNRLSGGQKQRLTIARAILKNPPILIFDEATSALDSESEQAVQEALVNVIKNRTTIVIAHRLSTIQHADEIVVIENGKIIERGTHKELLFGKGKYKKLVDLQAF